MVNGWQMGGREEVKVELEGYGESGLCGCRKKETVVCVGGGFGRLELTGNAIALSVYRSFTRPARLEGAKTNMHRARSILRSFIINQCLCAVV